MVNSANYSRSEGQYNSKPPQAEGPGERLEVEIQPENNTAVYHADCCQNSLGKDAPCHAIKDANRTIRLNIQRRGSQQDTDNAKEDGHDEERFDIASTSQVHTFKAGAGPPEPHELVSIALIGGDPMV